ncbi:MAG: hypothetical protein L0Z50_33985 [Verrucomicrobiales bacterium]|nr:hypothetical protein [Verrucomicrobiales bacterium]
MAKPVINLEQVPGKVIGRVSRRSPAEFLDRMLSRFQAFGLKLPYRKGVYRFKTFQAADAWQMKHQISAAMKRLRDHQR